MSGTADLERLSIDTIRTLSMDAVQAANSGHPGTPMSMAPVAYTVWQKLMNFDPADPIWPNRDRFVLSIGHASMLLYSMLHLTGVKAVNSKYTVQGDPAVSLEEIKKFRQLDSKCPGHPEYHWTSGVETTTGPLGQGCGNSVGMAIAGKYLGAHYNRPGFDVIDYKVYTLCGDGDMMEGISGEAASLAGHLKLDNLCWIYDSNRITIEGRTDLAFTEDTAKRLEAYGWNVLHVDDANDIKALEAALNTFKATKGKPTFIVVKSVIGYGAPNKQDTHSAHGEPLGPEEIKLAKKSYGWDENKSFFVPDGVYDYYQAGIGARGKAANAAWRTMMTDYKKQFPAEAAELELIQTRELPEGWDKDIPVFPVDPKGVAGRDASGKVLNAIAKNIPWLIGGSADLAPSTKTRLTFEGAGDFQAATYGGRNFHFGIREHAMASIMNGMSLEKVRPFGSGFLIFSDYAKPALRISAILEVPVIHVFTHDSIGVGEDGPTHQPIEQLISLRSIPGYITLRPADANEVAEAWKVIMKLKHEPASIVVTRQALPTIDRTKYASAAGVAKGGYVLADSGGTPDVILIGTGSEVQLCVGAYEALVAEGVKARVVSLPSWELFEHQDAAYRESVLPAAVTRRVAVEQASTMGWAKYTGLTGEIVAMKGFGASAPYPALQKKFGFTVERVLEAARAQLAGKA
jgi:transketolase